MAYSATGIVGDQAFSNAVLWSRTLPFYAPGQLVDEGLQTDLNGKLWVMPDGFQTAQTLVNVGAGNPLYYSPAAAYYDLEETKRYRLYAFSTGTFYEQALKVEGNHDTYQLCTGTNFCPKLYIAAFDATATATYPPTAITAAATNPSPTQQLWVEELTNLALAEPNANGDTTLTNRAQTVSSPILLLPASGHTGDPFAIYLVYDPDSGECAGDSYVFMVTFQPGANNGMADTSAGSGGMFHASTGVAGGFATVAGSVIVSISGVGQGQRATVVKVPDIQIGSGSGTRDPVWWMELK
jgi:hypothetical protein